MKFRWSPRLIRVTLGLLLVAATVSERLWHSSKTNPIERDSFISQLDNFIYDSRLSVGAPAENPRFDSHVVIVDIDEASLASVGRWPWSRTQVAKLIGTIGQAKPSVIGTDIVFAEPQPDDLLLKAELEKYPSVLGYYFSNDLKTGQVGKLPSASFSAETARGATKWKSFAANTAVFEQQAAGFFNPVVDSDGKVRRLPLLAEFEGQIYDSFAVAVLRMHFASISSVASPLSISSDRLGWAKTSIPMSQSYTALVPFSQRSGVASSPSVGRFKYLSAAAVLDGRVSADEMTNKIVLLGTSAIGITDLRATPVNQVLPGVETHATLISGALNGQVKQQPINANEMSAILLTLGGGLIATLLAFAGPSGILFLSFVVLVSLFAGFSSAFSYMGWWLPSASAYLLLLSLAGANLILGFWVEGRARRAMQSLFGEYVPAHLVDQMSRQPKEFANMASENRELSIMFADIRGFTRIAEGMEPEQLRSFINEYLTTMTDVIHQHGGTVDKYIGDAIMAFWGAPLADAHHADHAVAAGLQMLQETERLSIAFERKGLPALAIGIGINTGVVCVGDMGSKLRRAYTVLGDAVNLAARFEAMTKTFSVPIILGETTTQQLAHTKFVSLGSAAVQGRTDPVNIFTAAEFSSLITQTIPQLNLNLNQIPDALQSTRV
jgi:adenylate cyclase